MQLVGKARRAGALFGGREPSRGKENPGVPGGWGRKALIFEGREGARRGRRSSRGSAEGEPERSESPGEQELPARNKHSGGRKGDGFSGGKKPLERGCKAEQVLQGSAGAEGNPETGTRSPGRRKALKGEAQERGELKEASLGLAS
jgi:hypothetical protein